MSQNGDFSHHILQVTRCLTNNQSESSSISSNFLIEKSKKAGKYCLRRNKAYIRSLPSIEDILKE